MKILGVVGLALLASSFVCAAQAEVVYATTGTPSPHYGADATAYVAASGFTLSQSATITDAHIWTRTADISQWDGTIEWYVFADDSNKPAATPIASGLGTNIVHTATGNTYFNLNEYTFDFNLDTPVTLAANTKYWLGIHMESDYTNPTQIDWEGIGGGYTYGSFEGTFDNWSAANFNHFAFYLTSTVPEPATWGLMIAGFAGLGFAARRRRITA